MARIYAFREDRLGFYFEVDKKSVLGRAPECNVLLFDKSSSRTHAEIFQEDNIYYIKDLGSTNGTTVNDEPVNGTVRLDPFDTIKIGQEVFIFEPGMEVFVGDAPSALIIHNLSENVQDLLTGQVAEIAKGVSPEDLSDIIALVHQLAAEPKVSAIESGILRYLRARFNITFMSILWPSRPPVKRLTSFMTSHKDKRLLLSHTPFIRAIRDREVLLWPQSISELLFYDRSRHVSQVDKPSLIGPLYTEDGGAGLMYIENLDGKLTEKDAHTFAALLGLLSPVIGRLANIRSGLADENAFSDTDMSRIVMASGDNAVKIVFSTAAQAAAGRGSILLTGETGSGKYSLAEYIHKISPRKHGRLITVNLPTIPPSEVETLLFGEAPAADGAGGRIGLIEQADCGTLFLRHVEYLPATVQKQILVALEEGLFRPRGAIRPRAVDLRVVSATSIDLWSRVEAGFFREDLYSRLSSLTLSTVPLRESRNGLDSLLNSFMSQAARDMGLPFTGLDQAAMEAIKAYHWPGNISELKLEAGLLVMFNRNGRVALEDLPAHLRMAPDIFMGEDGEHAPPLIMEAERYLLVRAMSRCGGDLEAVAKLLNQPPENIILKMRAFGLDPIDYQAPFETGGPRGPGSTSVPEN